MSVVPMRITEIFFSIQGESSYAGLPCAFVRTTGCDLRCTWCDSEYTFTGGTHMSVEEILERIRAYPTRLVELTGGEPLLQKDIYELAGRLLDEGYTVLIETGGHRDVSRLDPRIIKVLDIKCPGSGMVEKTCGQTSTTSPAAMKSSSCWPTWPITSGRAKSCAFTGSNNGRMSCFQRSLVWNSGRLSSGCWQMGFRSVSRPSCTN